MVLAQVAMVIVKVNPAKICKIIFGFETAMHWLGVITIPHYIEKQNKIQVKYYSKIILYLFNKVDIYVIFYH